MNVQNMLKYTADLSRGVTLTPLRMAFVRGEALAHMFIITAYENNQKVDLTGATVNGYMMRGDQTTLTFDGSVSDGNAVISLPGAAYSVTGRFRLAIQATMNGVTTTLFYGEGAVSPSTTDVIAIPEEILMPSLENIEAEVERMKAATAAAESVCRGAVVRNLLDNSDFRIAQAGYGGKHGNVKYACDRWLDTYGFGAFSFDESNGLTISYGTNHAYAVQRIENASRYHGKVVTLAVGMADGTVHVKSAKWLSDASSSAIYFDNATFFLQPASVELVVREGSLSIKWAALYEGSYTADTLPAYQPKGYAAELMECKRYFQKVTARAIVPYYVSKDMRAYSFMLETEMRTVPTITLPEKIEYNDGSWGSTGAEIAVSAPSNILVTVTASGAIAEGTRPHATVSYEASADL